MVNKTEEAHLTQKMHQQAADTIRKHQMGNASEALEKAMEAFFKKAATFKTIHALGKYVNSHEACHGDVKGISQYSDDAGAYDHCVNQYYDDVYGNINLDDVARRDVELERYTQLAHVKHPLLAAGIRSDKKLSPGGFTPETGFHPIARGRAEQIIKKLPKKEAIIVETFFSQFTNAAQKCETFGDLTKLVQQELDKPASFRPMLTEAARKKINPLVFETLTKCTKTYYSTIKECILASELDQKENAKQIASKRCPSKSASAGQRLFSDDVNPKPLGILDEIMSARKNVDSAPLSFFDRFIDKKIDEQKDAPAKPRGRDR